MKLIFSEFFYSLVKYYTSNIGNCILIQVVPPPYIGYSNIYFLINSVTRDGNTIYVIALPPTCNTLSTFRSTATIYANIGKCNGCSVVSYFNPTVTAYIPNQDIQVLSTTFYIRIILPPDIT